MLGYGGHYGWYWWTAGRFLETTDNAYVRADAHALPYPDDTFDSVVCLAALYLIPDPLPVIDELVRVAKPGGEVAVFTSVVTNLTGLPGVRTVTALTGYRIFGRAEIVDRLRAAGAVILGKTNLSEWANFRSTSSISGWSARGHGRPGARAGPPGPGPDALPARR